MINYYKTEKEIKAGYYLPKTTDRELSISELSKKLNFDKYFFGNQIHSGIILNNNKNKSFENGDGLISVEKGVLLSIFTADCVPVTLYSDEFTGLIHAGWRGFVNGIFENFNKLIKGISKAEIKAIIGPSICKNCYEVGKEVADNFNSVNLNNNGKYLLNLKEEAVSKLKSMGIKNKSINVVDCCTYCSTLNLPSYRKNKTSFRIVNFIGSK